MDWIEINLKDKKYPGWLRSAAIDEHGTVFAPAALIGNEPAAFLCASWDGVPIAQHRGHVFMPTAWLARVCPQIAVLCGKIECQMRAIAADSGGCM